LGFTKILTKEIVKIIVHARSIPHSKETITSHRRTIPLQIILIHHLIIGLPYSLYELSNRIYAVLKNQQANIHIAP